MPRLLASLALFAIMSIASAEVPETLFIETAHATLEDLTGQVSRVSADRRKVLDPAVDFVAERIAAGEPVLLTFICTHNSRRSHLAQIWAQIAADYYRLPRVETYSGGTEATACNIRTVRSLRRSGLQIVASSEGDNPVYLVQYAEQRAPLEVYSKVYNDQPNPQQGYAAMMCCSDVDERCPIVHGAAARIPLHYIDPKASDDTPQEAATYDERSIEIGSEMFYVFSQAAKRRGD